MLQEHKAIRGLLWLVLTDVTHTGRLWILRRHSATDLSLFLNFLLILLLEQALARVQPQTRNLATLRLKVVDASGTFLRALSFAMSFSI